jgi:hypothetical protein
MPVNPLLFHDLFDVPRPSRNGIATRSPSRGMQALAFALALPLLTTSFTACDPADDGPPPATAANAAGAPGDPLPPGPPIAPAGGAVAESAPPSPGSTPPADSTRYASDEYAIGADGDSDSYADNDPSALTDFRQPLEPYGSWSDDPTYGTVWTPTPGEVGPDFTPYVSGGHWAYDNDYVWVSDYSWGWAPFHYGRWVFIEGRGWAWVPGREYRGAWVGWEVDDGYGYLGWAPLGPTFLWFGGVPVGYRGYWGPRWAYVPRGEVFAPRVRASVVVGPSAVAISARMHPYAVAEGHLGPPPERFGYRAAQIPHVSGNEARGVEHAQQFSHPSTARTLGASAPTRIDARPTAVPSGAPNGRGPLVSGPREVPQARPTNVSPAYNAPRVGASPSAPRTYAAPAPQVRVQSAPAIAPRPAPAAHPAPHVGGGGPHHR